MKMTVTIEGPQGVGKTTLALLLTSLLRAEWPEGYSPDRFPVTVDGEAPPFDQVENARTFHRNLKELSTALAGGDLSIDIVTRQTP